MSFVWADGKLQLKEEVEASKQESYNPDIVCKISKFWNEAFFDLADMKY